MLTGRWLSLARPNDIGLVANGETLGQWRITDPAWTFHDVSPVALRIEGGHDVLVRLVSRAPAITQPSDTRPLTFAVSNLTLADPGGRTCTVTQ